MSDGTPVPGSALHPHPHRPLTYQVQLPQSVLLSGQRLVQGFSHTQRPEQPAALGFAYCGQRHPALSAPPEQPTNVKMFYTLAQRSIPCQPHPQINLGLNPIYRSSKLVKSAINPGLHSRTQNKPDWTTLAGGGEYSLFHQ